MMKYDDFLVDCENIMRDACLDSGIDYDEFLLDLALAMNMEVEYV